MNKLLKSLTALAFLPVALVPVNASDAWAEDVIGLSLPMNKRYIEVSKRFEFGALQAQKKADENGAEIDLRLVDDKCDVTSAPQLAEQFSNASAVVGLPCFKVAAELARTLKSDGNTATLLTFRTRNPALKRLREVEKLPIIEFSNAPNAEAQAVVDFILPQLGNKPYAILDDGSVYGRGLADTIRLITEETGRKPIASANFRPLQTNQRALLRRLERSGVEAVIIAADSEDVVTIANDLSALKFAWPIAVGEQIGLLPYASKIGDVTAPILGVSPKMRDVLNNDAQNKANSLDVGTDSEVVLGHVMVEVATQLIKSPSAQEFETIVGKINLGSDARIVLEPFQLVKWSNNQLSPVESN